MTATAGWLHWSERAALGDRLEALADQFDTRQHFELWRSGLLGAFIGGGVGFVGTAEGGWLLQGGEGYWAVIASVGAMDAADLRAIFKAIQAEARLVVWDDEMHEGWPAILTDLGARPYVRQTYVQDLTRVAFPSVPDDGLRIVPYAESPDVEAALALLAEANADGLEGMFLTLPMPPTIEHCREALARVMAGAHGDVLNGASFVATEGDRVVGTLLCTQGDHAHQGVLFDLYVDPAARGRQLSRRLVSAMQRALLDRGYTENRFLTMGENVPVHRLFRDEEIADVEETRGGYWRRE